MLLKIGKAFELEFGGNLKEGTAYLRAGSRDWFIERQGMRLSINP